MRRCLPWVYLIVLLVAAAAGVFVPWEEWLQQGQDSLLALRSWCDDNLVAAIVIYALAYITFTGLSFPGALFLTIFGGWLFGLINVVIVSIVSAAGATIACWVSRVLFRERVMMWHPERWRRFEIEFARHRWVYLLALRLNPLVPYVLVNLFFGLTRMPLWQFWLVTQVGLVPITFLYVWAGAELGRVETLSGLISPRLIIVLTAVSVLPLILRWAAGKLLTPVKPLE